MKTIRDQEVKLTASEQQILHRLNDGQDSCLGTSRRDLAFKGLVNVLDSKTVVLSDLGRHWVSEHPRKRP